MWKSSKSRAEQLFATSQNKDDTLVKQKERRQRERDDRMARLRDLRLAKEAAEQKSAAEPPADAIPEPGEPPLSAEELTARLPKVHPHRS